MFLFIPNENIWDISSLNIPQMNTFEDGFHFQFERPTQIQVNIEQVHFSSQVVFSLKPGILSIIFLNDNLTIYLICTNIMYCSALRSKALIAVKVDKVLSYAEAKCKKDKRTTQTVSNPLLLFNPKP